MASHKGAQHHSSAADHHEHAAKHHREAAKHYESGAHEKGGHHAHVAQGHAAHAMTHGAEAAKHIAETHGAARNSAGDDERMLRGARAPPSGRFARFLNYLATIERNEGVERMVGDISSEGKNMPDDKAIDSAPKYEKPQNHYANASDIAADETLSPDEKKKALDTWEQDARQLLTASNEGMPGRDEGVSREDAPKLGEVIRAKADIGEKPKPKPAH